MAKYILEQIKIAGEMKDLLAKTNGENVALNIGGQDTTLAEELARILVDIAAKPSTEDVNTAVSTAIDALIAGAPGTYDTLKEIADYIAAHSDTVDALNAAIGNKVDKVAGMGLSANDFTDALKTTLEKIETTLAGGTTGQVLTRTASGYAFADAPAGVRYGTSIPADMKDGEMFVRVVE